MPEGVTDKLAKFTPTGLDRDAVLFAAGKAAGRGWRGWKWLACALLGTNAVTVAALVWTKPTPAVSPATPSYSAPEVPNEPAAPPPTSYLALMRTFDLDSKPTAGVTDGSVPSPPLTPRSSLDPRFN